MLLKLNAVNDSDLDSGPTLDSGHSEHCSAIYIILISALILYEMSIFVCYLRVALLIVVLRVEGSFCFNLQHNRVAFPHRSSSTVGNINYSFILHRRRSSSHYHQNDPHDAVNHNIRMTENVFAQIAKSYIRMMRPVTIIQAVGAFLVGRLVILTSSSAAAASSNASSMMKELPSILTALISIYLSYGAGMAMNDCADVAIDSIHEDKQYRSVASETISMRNASLFCVALSISSLIFSFLASCWKGSNVGFPMWNLVNLTIMAMYALGVQRIFLVKNLICGYLAIAPLIGASLLGGGTSSSILGGEVAGKLYKLACIGFPLQVAREILKDIEDVDVDEGTKKTLPLGELYNNYGSFD